MEAEKIYPEVNAEWAKKKNEEQMVEILENELFDVLTRIKDSVCTKKNSVSVKLLSYSVKNELNARGFKTEYRQNRARYDGISFAGFYGGSDEATYGGSWKITWS